MAREDLTHAAKVEVALPASTVTADANGATIDTSGFESVTFAGQIAGATAAADVELVVQDSEDGAAWADADVSDIYNETVKIGASEADGPFQLGYRGDKRFVRINAAFAAGSVDVAAVCVLAHAREVPTYGASA